VTNAQRPGLVVAIDGPGSSGKSSVGAAAALELGYRFCDTGLLYRAATWLALKRRVPADRDPAALVALVPEIELVPDANGRLAHVTVDGQDVTDDVHTPRVDEAVSAVSRVPELRAALLSFQRALAAEPGGIVMAGRDIGTVVLPDADLKIFLTASPEARAARRSGELKGVDVHTTREALIKRDAADSSRKTSPLAKAGDAVEVDTTELTLAQVIECVVTLVEEKRAGK